MTATNMSRALAAERLFAERVMAKGTVKSFSAEEGYGSICPDEGDEDIIVQATSTGAGGLEALTEGARVEFEVDEGRRGLEAFNVLPIEAPPWRSERGIALSRF